MKKALLLTAAAVTLFACSSNKSKLAGNWKITSAYAHEPELEATSNELYKKDSACGGCSAIKTLEDSVQKIRTAENDLFKNTTYQLNEDGSFVIGRGGKEYKGTWNVNKGSEYLYVDFMVAGKLLEHWFLHSDDLSIPYYTQDHKLHFDMNEGGQLDMVNGFYVSLDLIKGQ